MFARDETNIKACLLVMKLASRHVFARDETNAVTGVVVVVGAGPAFDSAVPAREKAVRPHHTEAPQEKPQRDLRSRASTESFW